MPCTDCGYTSCLCHQTTPDPDSFWKPTKIWCGTCGQYTWVKSNGDCPTCQTFLTGMPVAHRRAVIPTAPVS
jgi:hypothetical protein